MTIQWNLYIKYILGPVFFGFNREVSCSQRLKIYWKYRKNVIWDKLEFSFVLSFIGGSTVYKLSLDYNIILFYIYTILLCA